jgi:hypothetical protein
MEEEIPTQDEGRDRAERENEEDGNKRPEKSEVEKAIESVDDAKAIPANGEGESEWEWKASNDEDKVPQTGKWRVQSNPSKMLEQSLTMVKWMLSQILVNMETKFPRTTKRMVKSNLSGMLRWFL